MKDQIQSCKSFGLNAGRLEESSVENRNIYIQYVVHKFRDAGEVLFQINFAVQPGDWCSYG